MAPPARLAPRRLERLRARSLPAPLPARLHRNPSRDPLGQYALFLFIRIQDDLLDRHYHDLALQFVADRFLVESLEAFRRVPGLPSSFWTLHHRSLRETADGILEVRALEREPGRFQAEHLALHSKVGAIFHLGAAALSHAYRRPRDVEWITTVQAEIAIVSQLGDDLKDLPEDLAAGRFTFVANAVLALQPGAGQDPGEAIRRLGAALLRPAGTEPVFARMDHALGAAIAAVPTDAPAELRRWLDDLAAEARNARSGMHDLRVRAVFGDFLP
ncbi:MAG: hypothetical protein KY466_16280 [Gemmatimonadetes bacterium]|nr:hypothetical protein [Gemmatimonadota bacterium]